MSAKDGLPKATNDTEKGPSSHVNGTLPSSATTPTPRGTKRTRDDEHDTGSTSSIPTFATPQFYSAATRAFQAADHANDGKTHLLLATTGSVATIKLPQVLHALSRHARLSIRVILSRSSSRFLQGQADEQPHWPTLRGIPNVDAIYTDDDEWARPWTRGAPILHIELRRWADMMLIAPLSANALGKMVNGICDDLISEVLRAWDADGSIDGAPRFGVTDAEKAQEQQNRTSDAAAATKKSAFGGDMMSSKYATPNFSPSRTAPTRPSSGAIYKRRKVVLVAPAMNTAMWKHPVTKTHVRVLEWDWNINRDGWVDVLRPQEKSLACGDTGDGAMMEWSKIVGVVEDRLELGKEKVRDEGVERNAKRART